MYTGIYGVYVYIAKCQKNFNIHKAIVYDRSV